MLPKTLRRGALILAAVVFSGPVLADTPFPPLDEREDPRLQRGLWQTLEHLDLDEPAHQGTLSVTLVDVTDRHAPRVAAVNGDRMMYAASLPKIAILLAAFKQIEQGTLNLDTKLREQLVRMIRYSSNTAATAMMNRVGKRYIADVLRSPDFRLYDPDRNGGLWVGKEYGRNGVWQRDPLHNLSHGATTFQVARFYYLLDTGRLVSSALTREMKAILSRPAIAHKFVKGLKARRQNATILRKSGTWRQWHADSALIEHDGHRYIAAALAQSPQGGQWLQRLIVGLDELVVGAGGRVAALDQSM